MPHRSPTRFLAPLALVAALLTVYLVARPELSSSPEPPAKPSTSSTAAKKAKKAGSSGAKKARGSSATKRATTGASGAQGGSYTVKPGDVLGGISEATGVSVADLMDFNNIDAQNLRVGQKLKLSP